MTHDVSWVSPERIIGCHFYGTVIVDDVHQVYAAVLNLLQGGVPPVHMLMDHRCVEDYRLSLRQFQNIFGPPLIKTFGQAVVIIPNPLMRLFSGPMMRTLPSNLHIVESPAAAMAILCEADDSVCPLPKAHNILGEISDIICEY